MRIQISMKTSDVFDQVKEAIQSAVEFTETDEQTEQNEELEAQAKDVFDKFFKYGEYVTLELDTEKQTLTVLPL